MAPSEAEVTAFAKYVRTTSLAIAVYDYLQTLPFEFRITMEVWKAGRLSSSFIFFMLIRYTSILVLTMANVAYFSDHFTLSVCAKVFILPSIFKMSQAMVSQAILAFRAFNLSGQSSKIGVALAAVYVPAVILEWLTSVYRRRLSFDPTVGNCGSIGPHGALGGWVYYAISIVYDFTMTSFCIVLLLSLRPASTSVMARVSRIMLVDGLWYFLVLGAANLVTAGFFRATDIMFQATPKLTGEVQTAVASLGYMIRWVMSQKLIMHLYEVSVQRRNESLFNSRTRSMGALADQIRRFPSSLGLGGRLRGIRTMPAQFDTKAHGMTLSMPSSFPLQTNSRTEAEDPEATKSFLDMQEEDVTEATVRFERKAQTTAGTGRSHPRMEIFWEEDVTGDRSGGKPKRP